MPSSELGPGSCDSRKASLASSTFSHFQGDFRPDSEENTEAQAHSKKTQNPQAKSRNHRKPNDHV